MKKIILINGFKRSGKDFSAKLFKKQLEKLGYNTEIMSMATPLKQMVCTQLEIPFEQGEDWKNNETNIIIDGRVISNFRRLYQMTGDAIKALTSDSIFGQKVGEKFMKSTADFVIVPDFRFDIELQGLLEAGVPSASIYTIRIEGNRAQTPSRDHASEWDLLDRNHMFDATIYNNLSTTKEILSQNILQFLKEYMEVVEK